MDRREFLKIVGISTATGAAALYGCKPKNETGAANSELGPIPTDKMTYRSFPSLGNDKISILGYGCMRWPTIPNPNGEGEIIDQDPYYLFKSGSSFYYKYMYFKWPTSTFHKSL